MIRWQCVFILLLSALLLGPAQSTAASPESFVKAQLQQQGKAWPGKRQTLSIKLYTTTSFSGSTRFDLPRVPGMLIMESEDRPLLGTEKVDGISYIFKQHEIDLFPQRAGNLTVPPFAVEFAVRGVDGKVAHQRFNTDELQLSVADIPGADPKGPVITTTDFQINDNWQPEPGKAKVGDAFTRTITMTAEDLPGMAFPPLNVQKTEGLGLYTRQPQVTDQMQRGEFTGKRIETISYVCEREGNFTVAEASIQWWNPEKESLQNVVLEAVELKVAANPLLQQEAPLESEVSTATGFSWKWLLLILLLSVPAGVLLVQRYRKRGQQGSQVKDLEKELFQQFQKSSGSNDAASTMQTLLHWLDCSGLSGKPASLARFIELADDQELTRQIKILEAELYAQGKKQNWVGEKLYDTIEKARKKLKRHKPLALHHTLPALNP